MWSTVSPHKCPLPNGHLRITIGNSIAYLLRIVFNGSVNV